MLFLSVRGFLDYAGPTGHSRFAWLPCCLPPTRNEVGILIYGLFAAQSPRPPMPLSTLQETPRDVPSKTRGQDGFATSFPVGLLHPLQHAGLSRRSPVCPSSAQKPSCGHALRDQWWVNCYATIRSYKDLKDSNCGIRGALTSCLPGINASRDDDGGNRLCGSRQDQLPKGHIKLHENCGSAKGHRTRRSPRVHPWFEANFQMPVRQRLEFPRPASNSGLEPVS